ncbi:winged helix-turn-helix domain-containing protein [Pontimicrobium sp. MEBiC06410]
MSKKKTYIYIVLLLLVIAAALFFKSKKEQETFNDRAKIAIREIGNQLLLSNKDSTSLILPIIENKKSTYLLSFEKELSFEPHNLVSIVDSVFTKTDLSKHYRVSVLQCFEQLVGYSYEMSILEENTIIPCSGRYLPKGCYTIEIKFTKRDQLFFKTQIILYIIGFVCLLLLLDVFILKKKKQQTKEAIETIETIETLDATYTRVGRFRFYPEQNKLVKEAEEISLSKKECELLEILVANPNQIIKRDEFNKKVWEDNGVFVGRSLDTYISKLRKKLQDDDAIKITNIHGVGYKFEIE